MILDCGRLGGGQAAGAVIRASALARFADVLLRTYAKCIAGRQEEAKRRILEATQPNEASPLPYVDSGRRVGDGTTETTT